MYRSLADSHPRDAAKVRAMFSSISRRYDLANHVLSCGRDFYWRRRAADIVVGWRPNTIVDLATGTGDLAIALQSKLPHSEVIGVDFSDEMLAVARRKGVRRVITADALSLPFANASFDCVTIAFGLRNFEDWSAAIREMARVLIPSGKLLVMEFSMPSLPIVRAVYRLYLHRVLPSLGSWLTKKKTAYDYLGDSIEKFPGGNELTCLMEQNGFSGATREPLTGGIVTIYTGTKRL
jgi:demethylmenaquinone methyltransferase/2-methoxy-6-polyprenyl-1,4-benzoquinol methylase